MSDDPAKRIALKVSIGDTIHEVTFDELTLSNNLGLEALVTILVEKGIFQAEELQSIMERIRLDRYRGPEG
ncbi:MAG TPA: hypothetical protein DEO84_10730 [candidate division Zixibacteria bacterium]|nr:hypothetical protein [candidate division Zixibacteria bacterium]HBZ01782.1 hypothetical protein [candidate division Zixibacteria bacterium]